MPEFLSVHELHNRTKSVNDMLVCSHKCFVDGLSDVISGPIVIRDVHCRPLDTRCTQVLCPQCEPMMMSDLILSATPDHMKILHNVQSIQQRTQHHMPLPVDDNIHYRLLKLVYSLDYANSMYRCSSPKKTVFYGVWHPYKYCVTLCWRRFYAVFKYFLLWWIVSR